MDGRVDAQIGELGRAARARGAAPELGAGMNNHTAAAASGRAADRASGFSARHGRKGEPRLQTGRQIGGAKCGRRFFSRHPSGAQFLSASARRCSRARDSATAVFKGT